MAERRLVLSVKRAIAVLTLVCLSGCASVRAVPAQEINEGAAVVSGVELLALVVSGRSQDAVRCVQLAFGAQAQMEVALSPQGVPKDKLWVLDFADVMACAGAVLFK